MRRGSCSACGSTDHRYPRCPDVYTCRRPPLEHGEGTELYALREAVWEQLSFRYPTPAVVVFQRLREEWGSLDERRLWRVLSWLAACKRVAVVEPLVSATGVRYASAGYVRRAA